MIMIHVLALIVKLLENSNGTHETYICLQIMCKTIANSSHETCIKMFALMLGKKYNYTDIRLVEICYSTDAIHL